MQGFLVSHVVYVHKNQRVRTVDLGTRFSLVAKFTSTPAKGAKTITVAILETVLSVKNVNIRTVQQNSRLLGKGWVFLNVEALVLGPTINTVPPDGANIGQCQIWDLVRIFLLNGHHFFNFLLTCLIVGVFLRKDLVRDNHVCFRPCDATIHNHAIL